VRVRAPRVRAGVGAGVGAVAAVGVRAPGVRAGSSHAAVALAALAVARGWTAEEEEHEQDDRQDLPAFVDALGADEHGVAEQQLRLLGRDSLRLRGGHGHLRNRGLGVGLVLRRRHGRVALRRGHGLGRSGV